MLEEGPSVEAGAPSDDVCRALWLPTPHRRNAAAAGTRAYCPRSEGRLPSPCGQARRLLAGSGPAATIGAMPGPLRVTSRWTVPEHELSWRFSRSSGPGGQSVNTTDSRAELSYDLARAGSVPQDLRSRALERLAGRLVDGVLTVTASAQRSQLQNREAAEQRLAQLLREAIAPPPAARRPTRPTRGSQERRLEGKRQRAQVKRGRQRRHEE